MTRIVFPDQTSLVDQIRDVIGRETLFYTHTVSGCYNCSLDPINNSSTNPFCPVCSGLYYIPTYLSISVSGYISWGSSENTNWVSGGQLQEGDCSLQIKSSETNLDLINRTDYVVIDDKKMRIIKKTLRGTPVINRIILTLDEIDDQV